MTEKPHETDRAMDEEIATTEQWFRSHLGGDYPDVRAVSVALTLTQLEDRERAVGKHVVEATRFAVASLLIELLEDLT